MCILEHSSGFRWSDGPEPSVSRGRMSRSPQVLQKSQTRSLRPHVGVALSGARSPGARPRLSRHPPGTPARPGAFLHHGVPATLTGPGGCPRAGRQTACLLMYCSWTPAKPSLKIPPSTQPRPGLPRDGELALKTPFVSSWTRLGTLEDRVKPST